MAYTPTFVSGDLPVIGVDAVGTAGAAAVSWLPLLIGAGIIYKGTEIGIKKYKTLKKEAKKHPKKAMVYRGWHYDSYRHSLAAKGIKTGRYRR
jgi:hypothetical protein